jgi:hypothetical protein
MTTNREAMRKLFRVEGGWNQLHLPAIFPDKPAPIIRRTAAGEREIIAARWGIPMPAGVSEGSHRQQRDQHAQRQLTALARLDEAGEPLSCPGDQLLRAHRRREPGNRQQGLDLVRDERRAAPIRLCGNLVHMARDTRDAEGTPEECDAWLTADPAEALKMQRPLPANALRIVATGEKEDPPPAPREDMPADALELPL